VRKVDYCPYRGVGAVVTILGILAGAMTIKSTAGSADVPGIAATAGTWNGKSSADEPGRTEDCGMTLDARAIAAAMARGALEVHYQPIVMLPSRQILGFEALARLRDLDGTLLSPAHFIPVAEESGLIVDLGLEVLRRAVAEAARWRSGTGAIALATISVNIAPAQLEQPDVVDVVTAVLAEHGVPGSALILEITESVATSPGIRATIEKLSALGIRVALDDFGTGFATLETLRHFPVQMLKLDRSFVAGVTREGTDRAIIRVVIQLAESLGLSVVAEGIETEEQATAVLQLGCPAMQGYYFARPDADPQLAAEAVLADGEGPWLPEREGPDRWPIELEGAVIAAARLLGDTDSSHRGAVHAIAIALARAAQLDEQNVRAVGRLALVHDVRRLMVDGALPLVLDSDERVRALATPTEPAAADGPLEVVLVRIAVAVVERWMAADGELGNPALVAALVHEAELAVEIGLQGAVDPGLAALLVSVAEAPPDVIPFVEIMDDLDRRRMGRRGMEERMRSVFGITKVLSQSRDTRELMRVALEEARRIVGAASASVERWERDTNQLRCLVNVGSLAPDEETYPENEVYPLADFAQARRTMLTGLPYIHRVDDPVADTDAINLLTELGRYSSAAVPIYVDRRIWGQLWFATNHGEPPFEAGDIEILMAVATLMGGVVVQAENLQRVDRMAFEDALTGVGNRRMVDDVLDRLSSRGDQAVVVLLDLDRLKEINDVQGHASGDAAIQDVADTLKDVALAYPGATVGRLGGDEFCVVLPGCSPLEAQELLESALEQLVSQGGPSVSMGLAVTAEGPWAPRNLLASADDELYRAKRDAHARADRDERRRSGWPVTPPWRENSSPTTL
jgi:diguanylate cyclase (GGDEF)-like protein